MTWGHANRSMLQICLPGLTFRNLLCLHQRLLPFVLNISQVRAVQFSRFWGGGEQRPTPSVCGNGYDLARIRRAVAKLPLSLTKSRGRGARAVAASGNSLLPPSPHALNSVTFCRALTLRPHHENGQVGMRTAEFNTANFHVPHAAHMPPCRKIEFVLVPQLVQAFHGCDIMFARVLITKRAAIAATVRANLNESANNARITEHTNSDTYRQNKRAKQHRPNNKLAL
jgi:hypothetical protein